MTLDYVIHAPVPYRHRSAGFRALYKLGDKLQRRGKTVAIQSLPMEFLKEFSDPRPVDIPKVGLFTPSAIKNAIHVVPEGVNLRPAIKSVRWLLSNQYQKSDGFLQFDWFGIDYPRLCVDVIEPDLFYRGDGERSGLAIYSGKYGDLQIKPMPGDVMITHEFPSTRKELADILRSVEGVISYDPHSMLNTEATICGTPVLMARGEMPISNTLFGAKGIIAEANDFYEAAIEAQEVAADYDALRKEIAHDVDDFITTCELKWS